MTDYISREMTIDAICRLCNANFEEDPCEPSECEMMSLLRKIPAADVRPVVRGKWVLEYEPNGKPYCFHCSVCDGDFHYIGITTKYDFCPNCGADMREES